MQARWAYRPSKSRLSRLATGYNDRTLILRQGDAYLTVSMKYNG